MKGDMSLSKEENIKRFTFFCAEWSTNFPLHILEIVYLSSDVNLIDFSFPFIATNTKYLVLLGYL